ncbi:MAG: hypothetical protein JJE46_09570 [Acidimicrobiia bacterium]|nr:hypothetical protein [Acidimicrobiia bacterium]
MHLDAATILLQWAAGGLVFLWVTTRGRMVSIGYGWLLRGVFGAMAIGAIAAELRTDHQGWGHGVFLAASAMVVVSATVALIVSVVRRAAGVSAADELATSRAERVAAMAGRTDAGGDARDPAGPIDRREFPPALDLAAPIFGVVALVGAAEFSGGALWLAAARLVVGAAFLGVVSDAMLLGHWYLTQPGLPRAPLQELVRWAAAVWPVEVLVLLLPPGMIGVLSGGRSDGYGGLIGWMWVVCALTTAILLWVTWLALRERFYSAVMAATGLLYLAILTAFGTDLVARALLAP